MPLSTKFKPGQRVYYWQDNRPGGVKVSGTVAEARKAAEFVKGWFSPSSPERPVVAHWDNNTWNDYSLGWMPEDEVFAEHPLPDAPDKGTLFRVVANDGTRWEHRCETPDDAEKVLVACVGPGTKLTHDGGSILRGKMAGFEFTCMRIE